jgi:type I restriction enzyme S subunit
LGAVPQHWVSSKVKNLARPGYKTFVDGDWIESPYITGEGIRLIQTGNIGVGAYREKGFRYINEGTFHAFGCTEFQPGDVLICRLGEPVGRACLAPDLGVRMITSVDVCILKLREDVLPAYVVYAMSSPRYLDWVSSLVRGSTRDRVSRNMLGGFVVPVPPVLEQAAVVRFLGHADRRIRHYIRAKQKLIKLLEEQKQVIIHHAVTRGLDPNVRLKASGVPWVGDIPEHWEVRSAKHLFREVDHRSATGTEVLLSLRMYHGLVPHNELSRIPITAQALVGFKKVKCGQIVMNRMRAAIGMFGLVHQSGLVSPDYAVFEPIADLDAMYFLRLFKTPAAGTIFRIESKGLGTGSSGFMRLYADRFGMIKLPVPPREEQTRIVLGIARNIQEIECSEERINREISLLLEFRSRLIADVVTGQLDVREAAAKLPPEREELEPIDDAATLVESEEALNESDLDAKAVEEHV